MRRRPSGSSEEEEDVRSPGTSGAASPSQHGEKSESAVVRSLSTTSRGSMDTKRDADGAATPRSKNAWTRSSKGSSEKELAEMSLSAKELNRGSSREEETRQRIRMRNPWSISWPTLSVVVLACILLLTIIRSFLTRQLDPKGCRMSYMRSAFVHFPEFDTEHTRFATKYNLHLYREVGVDDDARVKGVPVLFIPGNAGSYKQARSLASEAAIYYQNEISHRPDTERAAKLPLDVFTVDFNEDITAFHGQTLLDQAEYLNDAVAFILSLYHNPQRSMRDPSLPDPSSVILIGHSMGGVVARTMLTMPNYQANTINSMVTLSAPHARPPVSFDANIVNTYKKINDYWRSSYSKQWGNENPLWHVTLISIAGGGLDTIVPSDYSSIASLVPETHGFTVFTSTIPGVWTGMDHLAITWCDQLRKSVIHALYEVVDVHQSGQTRRRAERMRTFKKWFLTGLEDVAERTLPQEDPKTLLTLEDSDNAILAQGERLTVRSFGYESKPKAYLMPLPPHNRAEKRRFTLLSDQSDSVIDVMFCSVFPLQPGQSASLFSMDMDLSGDSSGSTRLACKSAMPDLVRLPASRSGSQFPFEETQPFSYLQYELEMLSEYQFVAVVDKATEHRKGFVIAEFGSTSESTIRTNHDLQKLFTTGMQLRLPSSRPISVDIKLPALHSSLLAFNLKVLSHGCGKKNELFQPLLRQYITDVYESRFFVNVKNADINLHGVAPYMPPSFRGKSSTNGLSLQLWTDPTCDTPLDISMHVDIMGSMGKLWMRYRTWFAALPLLIVALALRKQFQVYDKTGVFISFSEGMNQCLNRSLAVAVLALTCLAVSLARTSQASSLIQQTSGIRPGNATETLIDYTTNDLLLGSADTFFWFLIPMFGLICYGICTIANWFILLLINIFALVYGRLKSLPLRSEEARRTPAGFAVTSTRQRVITTSILLLLVSTVIPYQFAYLVLCLVQLATCIRAWRLTLDTNSDTNYNFYNYAHSLLVLMLWILPINMPVLVVWIRNLAVHWLTPFSSHHNILSIMPYILLVETLSTGRMVPRLSSNSSGSGNGGSSGKGTTSTLAYVTNTAFFVLAMWAAVFGVSYAYQLHHFVNGICAWLVLVHLSTSKALRSLYL